MLSNRDFRIISVKAKNVLILGQDDDVLIFNLTII